MSIWVRAICRRPVFFNERELLSGIGKRLDLLIALYCPDEEPSKELLSHLRIETIEPDVWLLRYSDDRFIRFESWRGSAALNEARELQELIAPSKGPNTVRVGAVLPDVAQITAFEVRPNDRNTLAWPVAVAAAAWVASCGDGLIHADGEGWMEPTPKEIRPVLSNSRNA